MQNQINDGTAGLMALNTWLEKLGVTPITGWRWRKKGWIKTINICGRVYISLAAIAEFCRRAEAGEFEKEHKAPGVAKP
jgi:hypothetical protein